MIGLQSLSRVLQKEWSWLLIGVLLGYSISPRDFFGINADLISWAVGIAVLDAISADWLLKRAFPGLSRADYKSIALIMAATKASQSPMSKIYAYAAAALFAKVGVIVGLGGGLMISIVFGR